MAATKAKTTPKKSTAKRQAAKKAASVSRPAKSSQKDYSVQLLAIWLALIAVFLLLAIKKY